MSPLYGSSGDDEADMEAKVMLIESSLPQMFEEYDYARQHGVKEPVVFLVDCEDELGSPMARAWEGDDAVDAAILENLSEGEEGEDDDDEVDEDDSDAAETSTANGAGESPSRLITTLARAFSLSDCRREVPDVFPYLAATFESPPPADGFLAVVVTAGGAATFTVPLSARPEGEGE